MNLHSDRVLQSIAEEHGVDKVKAAEFFTSPANTKKLLADIQRTKKKGILGVPHFSIFIPGYNDARPVAFSGAQSKSGFTDTIQKLLKEYAKSKRK